MASGRKDYWIGVSPEMAIFGTEQTPVMVWADDTLTPDESKNILEYDVAAGYNFFPTRAVIACSNPGINMGGIFLGNLGWEINYFDTSLVMMFGNSQVVFTPGGLKCNLIVTNMDVDNISFYATLYGFLMPSL